MSNNQFSALDIAKWFAIHIRTKVSYKITIRKIHVYIDRRWPWVWNQYFYEMAVLPSLELATRSSSQNRKETEFINELWLINLYMNIGISNWSNWIFDQSKWCFWIFSVPYTIIDPNHMKPFSSYLVGRNGAMRKTCFSVLLNAKKDNQLKHKNQLRNRLLIDS